MIKEILEALKNRFKDIDIRFVVLEPDFNPTWSFWVKDKEVPDSRIGRQEMSNWRMLYTESEIQEMVTEQVSAGIKKMGSS